MSLAEPDPPQGRIAVSELAKKILRPQNEQEELVGLREAVLKAPDISAVYSHYRGENLPDEPFCDNALVDKFGIPKDKVAEFKAIVFDTLKKASSLKNTMVRKGYSISPVIYPALARAPKH